MWFDDDNTPEPAAWINFNAATSERNVSFVCESELASIPLWPEPPRQQLPEEHLAALCRQYWDKQSNILDHLAYARAIERQHGIGSDV